MAIIEMETPLIPWSMRIAGKSGCTASVTIAETNGLAQLGGENGAEAATAFAGGGAGAGVSSPACGLCVVVLGGYLDRPKSGGSHVTSPCASHLKD